MDKSFEEIYGTSSSYPDGTPRHRSVMSVLVHFSFEHLRDPKFRATSEIVCRAAYALANSVPEGPDLVKALNNMKIAKDWAVCAVVVQDR